MDKNEAIRKIKFQTSKRKKEHVSDERKMEMVQGIIDANTEKEFMITSDMPEKIMGVEVDWQDGKVVKVVERDSVKRPEDED